MPKEQINQLFEGKYFSIKANHDGTEFVQAQDEVMIVPIMQNEEVILTREPSSAFAESVLILPGGSIESNEQAQQAAHRELQEEIGYKANQIDFLGELKAFSKYLKVRTLIFMARKLKKSMLPKDEEYKIAQEKQPLRDFEKLIENGELKDARVIAALLMARNYLTKK